MNLLRKLVSYFLQGALLVLPLSITVYIFYLSFIFIDNLIPFKIPGLGFLVILGGVTFVGMLGKFFITKPIFAFFTRLLDKTPLVNLIFKSVKDLLSAFVGTEKKFDRPVLVIINKSANVERLGFITQEDLSEIGISNKKMAVYLPSSYGILGDLYIVPSENITPIDVHSAEVMKFIVSGGVSKS
ncbi:MAG: DUF502 domain-containing protein [Chlorobi bacterium]|nr:DUF502 domain-containing protein [Chlorobiota bacterium]